MRVAVLALLITIAAFPLPADSAESTDDSTPARLTHAGVSYSPFLPVVTAGIQLRASAGEHLAWGVALDGFYALGRSIHVELFVEPIYLVTERWRLSSRLGALVGLHEEFALGPPPQAFVGPGVHLVPVEVMAGVDGWYVGLSLGLKVASDLGRVAGSAYVGLIAGVRAHEP